jgi:hypothetical protein
MSDHPMEQGKKSFRNARIKEFANVDIFNTYFYNIKFYSPRGKRITTVLLHSYWSNLCLMQRELHMTRREWQTKPLIILFHKKKKILVWHLQGSSAQFNDELMLIFALIVIMANSTFLCTKCRRNSWHSWIKIIQSKISPLGPF